ncbi:MAG: hypothetical protein ACU0DK_07705 [Pseudooceanicola sp.]
MVRSNFLLAAALAVWPVVALGDVFLLMAEEKGCPWCARWNEEVGDAYHLTEEGRAAPLVRYDIHGPQPEGVTLDRRVFFTPTFILVENGVEIARIEGYPGEDFFWGLLARVLSEAGIKTETRQDG